MFPSAEELHSARAATSAGFSTRSHRLNWESSPTRAWEASKCPPNVSLGRKQNTGLYIRMIAWRAKRPSFGIMSHRQALGLLQSYTFLRNVGTSPKKSLLSDLTWNYWGKAINPEHWYLTNTSKIETVSMWWSLSLSNGKEMSFVCWCLNKLLQKIVR